MEKQLSFEVESLSSRKQKSTSLKQHLFSEKEQEQKKKDKGKRLVSELLPKIEKELKLKSLTLKDKVQEKTLSEVSPLKEDTSEVKTSEESLSDKEKLFVNLISVEELAVIFRLAPQTIRNWIALGKIPYVKIGRRRFFQRRSVQEWLNRKEKSQWR